MSYKKAFLKLPLNAQINFSIIFMTIIIILLILLFSQGIISTFIEYLLLAKKKYFFNMQQNIIENNIFFTNICFLQYENLIKLFNYQFYVYLGNEELLKIFARNNYIHFDDSKVRIIYYSENSLPPFDDDPSLVPDEYKKLYVYLYAQDDSHGTLIAFFKANCLSFLNQIGGVGNFRLPFYGNISILHDYIIFHTKYKAIISLNYTSIYNTFNIIKGNINLLLNYVIEKREFTYNLIKKFFDDYRNNKLHFLDIMYSLRYDIFYNYSLINDKKVEEKYIKEQAIFFQTVIYENDTTIFHDSWFTDNPIYQGQNSLIKGYIDFLLFHLSSKIETYSIPFSHEKKKILSKNLCYYFLLKQIINLNITSDEIIYELNSNFINRIYEEINKKTIENIDDCKLETYYPEKKGEKINAKKEFSEYYDLEFKYDSYIYLFRDKDINSIIFEMRYSYPNLLTLKDIFPSFFSFRLDFYSFSFGNEITKIIDSSKDFYMNIKYLIIICLYFNWIIIISIIIFISSRTIKQITEPIIHLTEIIDLNNLNDKNINDDIFEYKADDEIKEFFVLCKKLINGEIQDYNYKKNENLERFNNKNNNMIINNKIILELIENQKSLNNDDKNIYLLKQNNPINRKKRKQTKNSSNSNFNKDLNSQGLGLIKLTSVANNEIENENENDNENKFNSSQNLFSSVDENDLELNNMKCYENLLNLADFLYNCRDKENNENNKSRKNININNLLKYRSASNISVKEKNENQKIRRDCKYITYLWYTNSKK